MRKIVWPLLSTVVVMLSVNTSPSAEEHPANVKKLIEDSAQKYMIEQVHLLRANPLLDSDLSDALAYIKKHGDYTSYHLLLALRKYYPVSYKNIPNEDKVAILCSTLQNTIGFNDWGVLQPNLPADPYFDGPSAKALLETGKIALKSLEPILDDNRPAILDGSEAHMASIDDRYRRKDYAYRYASLILGKLPAFHTDPKVRDKDIEVLKAELKKHGR
jgi:hypothetical protein